MAKLLPTNDAAPIDRGRADVAQATYRVEHRFDLLMHAVDLDGHEFMVCASLPRMKELTCVAMPVLGDDSGRQIEELLGVVHG